MATDTVYDAVRAQLAGGWTTTPLHFDNENCLSDGSSAENRNDPWVLVEMTGDIYEQASIGAGDPALDLYREEGTIWLNVLVRSGTGSQIARAYARQLISLFKGIELSNGTLRFLSFSVGLGEKWERNGNWFVLPVSIEFQQDH